jgi:hypothetical protein
MRSQSMTSGSPHRSDVAQLDSRRGTTATPAVLRESGPARAQDLERHPHPIVRGLGYAMAINACVGIAAVMLALAIAHCGQ